MKKIIVFLLVFLSLGVTALAADEILIGTPTVDGFIDGEYLNSYKIEVSGRNDTFHTSKGGTARGSYADKATAYYLYDADYLYVVIDVKDKDVYSRGKEWIVKNIAALSWENDAVEARVYYEELGEPVRANQYIFQCDAKGIATTNYLGMCKEAHLASVTSNESGYTVEFALPLSFDKKAGDKLGLSIEIDDLQEHITGANTSVGGHKFNAYGSQHPYENMVTLGLDKAEFIPACFSDVGAHWAKEHISYVAHAGIFNGTQHGFEPDGTMTRAMFATVLGRIYERKIGALPSSLLKEDFNDVDYGAWYGKYVSWASGAGVVTGGEDGRFYPDSPITREEMATMLFRYTKASAPEVKIDFADAKKISVWAKDAVAYCVYKGYIMGGEGHLFSPKNTATRAEVSAVLARYLKSTTVTAY